MLSTVRALACLAGLSQDMLRSDDEMREIRYAKMEQDNIALQSKPPTIFPVKYHNKSRVIPIGSYLAMNEDGYVELATFESEPVVTMVAVECITTDLVRVVGNRVYNYKGE